MDLTFEWDPKKASSNLAKHRVSFTEATSVFGDPLGVTIADPDHSSDEDRYLTLGATGSGRTLIVAHTDRASRIRLISARELTPAERRSYEDASKDTR